MSGVEQLELAKRPSIANLRIQAAIWKPLSKRNPDQQ